MIPTDVYTFTMGSGQVYTISLEASTGEIFLTKVFLCLIALAVLDMAYVLIYRR
jgi:hypothetical protein